MWIDRNLLRCRFEYLTGPKNVPGSFFVSNYAAPVRNDYSLFDIPLWTVDWLKSPKVQVRISHRSKKCPGISFSLQLWCTSEKTISPHLIFHCLDYKIVVYVKDHELWIGWHLLRPRSAMVMFKYSRGLGHISVASLTQHSFTKYAGQMVETLEVTAM